MTAETAEPVFRVLGAVAVRPVPGRDRLAAGLPRLLLAILLSRPGAEIGAGTLIDALWRRPGPAARNNLAAQVRRLRRCLDDPDRLAWHGEGYRLELRAGELDATEFDRLLVRAGGTPADRAARLRGALRLWRGTTAYGDLGDHPALSHEAARLAGRRLLAMERCFDAELAAGRHAEIAAELTAVATAEPLHERFCAQAMLAAYRSGRRADALERYAVTSRALRDELGLDPGAELRSLHRAVLRAEPAEDVPSAGPTVPAELPPDPVTLTGRMAETRRLVELLDGGGIAVVTGGGGVGKSALAVHVAHRLRDRFPDGQLYVNLNGATPGAVPCTPIEVLARFHRSLGDADAARLTDVGESAARFRTAVADRRVLVVLDDAAGVAQIRALLPGGGDCGVVVTSRRGLASLDGVTRLELTGLARADSVALLARLTGAERCAADPAAADAVAESCGDLPLALCVAAARLNTRPQWTLRWLADLLADTGRRLSLLEVDDRGVRASFDVGYRGVADDPATAAAADSLLHAGLLDADRVDPGMIAAVSARDTHSVGDHLDVLADARLLERVGPERYRFHDLVRLCVREHAAGRFDAEARRASLRRACHHLLATARNALMTVDRHQRHRAAEGPSGLEATGAGFPHRQAVLDWLTTEIGDIAVLLRQFQAELPGEAAAVAAVAACLLPVCNESGNYADLRTLCGAAVTAARRDGDPDVLAAALHDLGYACLRVGDAGAARRHLTEAAESYTGPRRSGILWSLGEAHNSLGDPHGALRHLGEALTLARRDGDARAATCVLIHHGFVHRALSDPVAAAGYLRRAVTSAADAGHEFLHLLATINLAEVEMECGHPSDALPLFEAAARRNVELSGEANLISASLHWNTAIAHDRLGDAVSARREWRRATAILHRLRLVDGPTRHALDSAPRLPAKPAVLLP
ncbi:DNA-binding SARP family transcriptional activator [Stackebrandtia albiflava]|uniref:DNA-binding SARP family transcriptional activator n=1 Tax=Stackebrandtia albiflava TaxID=406432 RepID=A0A562UR36_9ACTN|nr:BTAD domain-containing putative transcriptional regulator [Stackebrandtia albiflava]TWJ08080.1 DNA-binding SARP family transcriptional activator [Stackebrandtia albiflava]